MKHREKTEGVAALLSAVAALDIWTVSGFDLPPELVISV
jgi:hypothetical protein